MYREFFGLEQQPFSLTPNTSLYYGLPPHEEALQVLSVAIKNGEGFIKISGEVGTGKSLVLRMFMSTLPEEFELLYIPNPILTPEELKVSIAKELGIDTYSCSNLSLNDEINHVLLDLHKDGKIVVLVIDEAQSVSDDTLEALRLLGNLETEHYKMLQIVLFGQPELDEKLEQEHLRQLKQRISFSYKLRPLYQDETYAYLNFRMRASGYKGRELFTKRFANKIYKASNGVPRLINIIANKTLMLAYGYGKYELKSEYIDDAIRDTNNSKECLSKLNIINFILFILIIISVTIICIVFGDKLL